MTVSPVRYPAEFDDLRHVLFGGALGRIPVPIGGRMLRCSSTARRSTVLGDETGSLTTDRGSDAYGRASRRPWHHHRGRHLAHRRPCGPGRAGLGSEDKGFAGTGFTDRRPARPRTPPVGQLSRRQRSAPVRLRESRQARPEASTGVRTQAHLVRRRRPEHAGNPPLHTRSPGAAAHRTPQPPGAPAQCGATGRPLTFDRGATSAFFRRSAL